jgi:23S rRNA pseudouridine2605 synthase
VLISQGRVEVDGRPAGVGDRIDPSIAVVTVDGVRLPLDPTLATWLVYKPVGVVTTMDDPQGRPTVRDLVPSQPVTNPVGRLDLHSEGLMLMTNDGDLALVVTHPRYRVPKTYQVLVPASVTPAALRPLESGVELTDGPARAASARVVSASRERTIVELVLTEGRKREIRRMFDTLDLPIDRLVRTAIGPIVDRSLAPGDHRALTPDEIRSLYRFAKGVGTDD